VFARTGPAPDGGGTVLTVASLTRGSGETGPRFAALTGQLRSALEPAAPGPPALDPPARGTGGAQ
jgi:cytochrome c biogenesis protein